MKKPNLFSIATKELSQDAFITWLIQWADESYKESNNPLHSIGENFVRFLIEKRFSTKDLTINKVEAGMQWNNIDIWADINEEYFIIIEDKIDTSEHDEQLKRYEKIVTDYYDNKRKLIPIYLKTGIESIHTASDIRKKCWEYCGRDEFLNFLNSQSSPNNIFSDYVSYLNEKNQETNSFSKYENLNSWEATKGLFVWIQKSISEWSGWDYVPNPSGGFLGLWFHFIECKKNPEQEFYLQIENYCDNRCNLLIKVAGEWSGETAYLYDRLEYLYSIVSDFGLTISKPSRYRPGEYTSLAIIDGVFSNTNGNLDLENLLQKIKRSMLLVDKLASNS